MTRRRTGAAAAVLALLAGGALASACDLTPPAATANGATVSTAALNTQLATLQSTGLGGCLLEIESPQLTAHAAQGSGGPGTYTMAFTDAVLKNEVGNLIVEQYAASRGITLSAADLSKADSDLQATLSGSASSAAQQSASSGTLSPCLASNGSALTGTQLLAGLPGSIREDLVRSEAAEERLLAMGADLSPAAVSQFYAANTDEFTTDCVSQIVTDTQAHAQQLVGQLDAGVSFAAVAKASSLDTQTAPTGGALGCGIANTQVEQVLQTQSLPTGQPIGPLQDQTTGRWIIYEITSQSVQPLSQATPVVREELLRTTANVNRVDREINGFARRSDVSVDPKYGTWRGLTIVPPHGPPDAYLLPAVSTATLPSSGQPSGLGGSSGGSSGTGGG